MQLKDLDRCTNTHTHVQRHTDSPASYALRALNNGNVKLGVLFSRYTCVGLALKRSTETDRRRERERGSALKADVPKGSVLQRICCTKNFDEKVFTDGEERENYA